ncbi:hypothetical protein TanjilG_20283 [Lupinus angustifolius]|uniref:Methyltransferase small domain-containing protein n=1 Tax=Lupinus angustifolius TaxID=3871 RepID=A0A1J7I1H3_LUPAN|nr:hypothetical protein TanjilG_20283 [Lupinus angustifolius]
MMPHKNDKFWCILEIMMRSSIGLKWKMTSGLALILFLEDMASYKGLPRTAQIHIVSSHKEAVVAAVITSLALILGQEGCGSNYIATDINQHAVKVTSACGVDAELIITDIVSGLGRCLAGLVDVMVVNPSYVPTPEDEIGVEGITSSWAGGENGRSVIGRVLPVYRNNFCQKRDDRTWVTLTTNNPSEICLQMRTKDMHLRLSFKDQQRKKVFIS